jgi:hypothetical protein
MPGARFRRSGSNAVMALAVFLLIVSIVAAIGVFAYSEYLKSIAQQKNDALTAAQNSVNAAAVEDFVRFRDRFGVAESILDKHVEASNFFALLESLTLANVRFNSLKFDIKDDGTPTISMSGTAKSFNALAAQSSAFTGEKRIKRAIFANIKVADTGIVTFSLTADLDPKLLIFTAPDAPAASEVPASTTPVGVTATSSLPADTGASVGTTSGPLTSPQL